LAIAPALLPQSEAFADPTHWEHHPKRSTVPVEVVAADPGARPGVRTLSQSNVSQSDEPQAAAEIFRAAFTVAPGLNSVPADLTGWSPWAPFPAQARTIDEPGAETLQRPDAQMSSPDHPVQLQLVRTLRSSSHVREIQVQLAKLGYLSAVPTGEWRTRSQEALLRFKRDHNLPPNAPWDLATEQAMFAPERSQNQFVGVWAPDASACRPEMNRNGLLTTLISEHGARAGGTTCSFQKGSRRYSAWLVSASCSDGREHWPSRVQLFRTKNNLLWVSAKGARSYTRCNRDAAVASTGQRRM
jgi:hypothetical protein